MAYDKAKYHTDGDYPEDLPDDNAFVHTGLYLGWIIEHGLYSDDFEEDFRDSIADFKTRTLTGPAIYAIGDGVFDDEMLNDEGNEFTRHYFDFQTGQYLRDYEEILALGLPTIYHVEDTWENYDKIVKRIDQRFEKWKRTTTM